MKLSFLVALIVALVPTAAVAAEPTRAPGGRNFVGAQIDASKDPYKQLNLLSMRVVDRGAGLNVWLLSSPKGCGGAWDVAVGKLAVDGQGRFQGQLVFGTPNAHPRGSATVEGQFVKTRDDVVVARTTFDARFTGSPKCGTGTHRVRAISPRFGRPDGGRPAPNALFVGTTQQSSSRIRVKLPMLALISRDGTQVKRFTTNTNVKCDSGRQAGGIFRIKDIPIQGNSFDGVTGVQRPVQGTDQKRTLVLNAKGTFGQRSLVGTWRVHEVQTDPYSNVTDDCDTGNLKYVAARVR
jgi:hypothetical protein